MKQTLLKSWLLMMCLLVGVGTTWGASPLTLQNFSFTAAMDVTLTTNDANISLSAHKGSSGTNPGNYNNGIRLYQASSTNPTGGYITIQGAEGITITSIAITTTGTYDTSYKYSIDGGSLSEAVSISKSSTKTISSISASSVNVYNVGTGSSGRLEIAKLVVTYTSEGGTTPQPTTLSVPSNLATSNVTTTGATLSWGAVSNASSYTVKIGETEYTGVNTNSYSATGLTAGTQYTWTVKAVGDGTNYATSAYAANATFTTEAEQGGEDGDDEDGENLTVTYNFNDASAYPSEFPDQKPNASNAASSGWFTIGGNSLYIQASDGENFYIINYGTDASRGLFYGKSKANNGKPIEGTAYLGFPAKQGYKLVKVVATATGGVAKDVKMNIYDESWKTYSTELTTVSGNGTKKEYVFNLTGTEVYTEYRLASGSSGKNLQFDNIVLTYEKVEVPAPTYSEAKALNVTADNGKERYFTTFSSDKVTFFPEYDEEMTFATSIKTAEVADEIFVLSQIEKGKATIGEEEVEGFFVPANTGVLVQVEYDGKAEKNVPYYEVENMNVDALENNDLHAGNGEMLPSGKVWYKLAWADSSHAPSTLGFYYGAAEGAPFTSTKGKAYLGLTPEQAAKKISFSLVDDETTSIKTIETVNVASAVYNLAGQRVAPNAKGIVIVNGKKFINK